MFLFADDCILANTHDINEPVKVRIEIIIRKLIFNSKKTNFIILRSSYSKVEDIKEIVRS
jgi:hypothetical protein